MTISWRNSVNYLIISLLLLGSCVGLGYLAAYVHIQYIGAGLIGLLLGGLILKNPLLGMYLLVFFLPFERIGSIDLFGITIRISHVIGLLTLLAWVIRGFALNKFKLRENPLFIVILGFGMINIIGLLNAPNIERALFVVAFTGFMIIISMLVPNILRHEQQWRIAIDVLLFSAIVVSAFGVYQFLGDLVGLPTALTGLRSQYTKEILGFPRVQSTALEPLYFANYLLIPLGIAVSLFLSKVKTIRWPLLLLTILLGGLNLILTVSRGGYIAFAVMALLFAFIYAKEVWRPRNVLTGLFVVVLVGVVAFKFFDASKQVDSFVEHVGNIFGGASYSERVETFEIANRIWQQHPFIGIGPGGFGPYASYHPLITPAEGFSIVNNEYIELLAETGTVGLVLFLIFIAGLYVRSWKALHHPVQSSPFLKHVLIGLLVALTGILIQYNTFSVLYIIHIWFTIGAIIAVQNLLLYRYE